MDAVKFLKERKRMCDSFGDSSCEGCLIYAIDIGTGCFDFQDDHPKQTVEIVEKWAAEHPEETRLTEFLKHYPNALMEDDGTPEVCVNELGLKRDDGCACRAVTGHHRGWSQDRGRELEERPKRWLGRKNEEDGDRTICRDLGQYHQEIRH